MGDPRIRCEWSENAKRESEAFERRVRLAAECLTGEKIDRLRPIHYRLVALDYIAHLGIVAPHRVPYMAEREPQHGTTWAEHCMRNGITATPDNDLGIEWHGYFDTSGKQSVNTAHHSSSDYPNPQRHIR